MITICIKNNESFTCPYKEDIKLYFDSWSDFYLFKEGLNKETKEPIYNKKAEESLNHLGCYNVRDEEIVRNYIKELEETIYGYTE